jgi:hypothetical protein
MHLCRHPGQVIKGDQGQHWERMGAHGGAWERMASMDAWEWEWEWECALPPPKQCQELCTCPQAIDSLEGIHGSKNSHS